MEVQESPPIGGAVRNVTTLIPERLSPNIMLAITCSENVYVCPCTCVRLERDDNTKITIVYTTVGPLETNFSGREANLSSVISYKTENDALEWPFPKL